MSLLLYENYLIFLQICWIIFIQLEWSSFNKYATSPLWVRIPTGTLDSFMCGSYPASLRNIGGSTKVPVRARRGTWGLPSPVKLKRRQMTYSVSVWLKPQFNKQLKNQLNIITFSFWVTENNIFKAIYVFFVKRILTGSLNQLKQTKHVSSRNCYSMLISKAQKCNHLYTMYHTIHLRNVWKENKILY
jgi:hypothetical protein